MSIIEKRYTVNTVIVKGFCEDCGGEMVRTGTMLLSSPPQHELICQGCGLKTTATDPYPRKEEGLVEMIEVEHTVE